MKKNRGSAGVDAQTLAEVESYGVDRFLGEIAAELKEGRYRPRAVLRRYIPKADGKRRPLGIPTVRDRVVQMAARLVLEPIVYFLQRWPSQRSMKRVRQRVKELTGRSRNGVKDVRVIIRDINPVLRGWGNYFRTGNAAVKFNQVDDYVRSRLRRFLVKRKGRNLRAGEADRWTRDFFHEHGLYRLGAPSANN